ncbi:MAG TPA: chorismate synthase [Saprospiraceae bacterium]|nr:chorismate synthase [Saprospiraceae bacterium]
MGGNTTGLLYRITTYGESHGPGIGVVIDGCPAGLVVDTSLLHLDLQRRKPGQSKIVTQRKEDEEFEILSGVFDGKTTGTPISVFIRNQDQRSKDYEHIANTYRPSHADFTYSEKYGIRDYKGGGRSSARETAARVIAGAFAKMILAQFNIRIIAYVSSVGHIKSKEVDKPDPEIIENNIVRCADLKSAEEMIQFIQSIKKSGDTVGGIVRCHIEGVPPGLGEPVFDKLHADLGKAMLSINAVKGFEIGSGFKSAQMKGSEHNDEFIKDKEGNIKTKTNHSGGIQGGISNGMPIYMNVAFKPVATILRDQKSVNAKGDHVTVTGKGRHDPCVVPRAVPIVEAMAALVLADHLLRAQNDQLEHLRL